MKEKNTTAVDVTQLSTEELKKLLAAKEQEERNAKEAKRKEYEKLRNAKVDEYVETASELNRALKIFKEEAFAELERLREAAMEYGDITKRSKGGFSLRNADGSKMMVLRRNVVSEYDERADLAYSLIREFLDETIKKKDIQTYRTISVLLEKNKSGDFKPNLVADLLKIKDNYNDPRWLKAMELLPESYREREVSYNVEFYQKDSQGKDELISLNIASIAV
jgi:hypothetical protein